MDADEARRRRELGWGVNRTRRIRPDEAEALRQRALAVHRAHELFESYLEDLYLRGVSQSSLGEALGTSQTAISARLRRRSKGEARALQPLQLRTGAGFKPYGRGD